MRSGGRRDGGAGGRFMGKILAPRAACPQGHLPHDFGHGGTGRSSGFASKATIAGARRPKPMVSEKRTSQSGDVSCLKSDALYETK
jgi:hypothetical protein